MRAGGWIVLFVVAVMPAALLESGPKTQRPELSLRATPRAALTPAEIQFVAAIDGGNDLEDYHCPEIEWDWDDGSRSVHQSDCSPDEPDAAVERRFSARHTYGVEGDYRVSVTLRRASRSVASASTNIIIRGQ